MGLSKNNKNLVTREEHTNERPETTTDSTNLQKTLPIHEKRNETCVNHRVKVSSQYECRMLSNTCGTLPSINEVIFNPTLF